MKVQTIDGPWIEIEANSEDEAESLWKELGGIDPGSGAGWLTPRMQRNSQELIRAFNNERIKTRR